MGNYLTWPCNHSLGAFSACDCTYFSTIELSPVVLNDVVSVAVVHGMFTYRLWGTGGRRTRLRAAMSKGCHSRPRCRHHSIGWSGLRHGDLGQGGREA